MAAKALDYELKLITTGPYAYIRYPVSVAAVLIGIGMIFLSDAFSLIVLLLAFFALHDRVVISAEEEFLKDGLPAFINGYSANQPVRSKSFVTPYF